MTDFLVAVVEMRATLMQATGSSLDELYSDGLIDEVQLDQHAAYAHGFLEGVATALDVTVLELFDQLGV